VKIDVESGKTQLSEVLIMKKGILSILTMLVILLGCVAITSAADQQPMLPHAFYGAIVMPNDQPVPANQIIEVHGEGVMTGIAGNPLLSSEGGFGTGGATSPKLMAQGAIPAGTPLTFTVGGVQAQVSLASSPDTWQDSIPYTPGEVTIITLRIDTTLTQGPTPTGVYVYPSVTANEGSAVSYNEAASGGGAATGGVVNPGSVPAYTTPPTRVPGALSTSAVGNQQPGAAPQSGDNTAGSKGLVQAQTPAGEPIPASWYIGGILIIVIIALGGFYYGRMKKEGEDKPDKKE
jgi:hypothetical protein